VTNSNSCTANASVQVNVNAVPTVAPTATAASICSGQSSTLAANATAGSGTISTYAWSANASLGNVSGGAVSPTSNATYTVTVTNSNTCTASGTVSVTVTAAPVVAPTASPATICNGESTTLAANATAGSGTISTYAWSANASLGNVSGGAVSPTSNATYSLTVTNSNNCATTASVAVTVNANPTVAPTATAASICSGQSSTLAANATAGSGTISTYAWSANASLGNVSGGSVSPTADATYTVTVTNSNNCSATGTATVVVNELPTVAPTASLPVICNGESTTLAANATAGSGTISTYAWSANAALGNVSGGSVSPTSDATYDLTVTNSNNCAASASVTVTVNQPSASTLSEAICQGTTFTFNGQTLTQSGEYSQTLTNAVGCDSIVTLMLTVIEPYLVSVSEAICSGESFDFNGQTLTQGGDYVADLISVNGCDSTVTLTLTVNPLPQPVISQDGAILDAGSFDAYQWQLTGSDLSGENGQTLAPAVNGSYTVVVTDANGCSATSESYEMLTVGISTAAGEGISVSPNPSSGVFVVSGTGAMQCTVHDALGREVLRTATRTIDLSTAPAGVYMLTVTVGNGSTSTARLVKH
jgi:hypothetical protein